VDYIEKWGDGASKWRKWRGRVGGRENTLNRSDAAPVKKRLYPLRPVKKAAKGQKKRL
jgi:hypothetical protein